MGKERVCLRTSTISPLSSYIQKTHLFMSVVETGLPKMFIRKQHLMEKIQMNFFASPIVDRILWQIALMV